MVKLAIEVGADAVKGIAESGEGVVEGAAHAGALAPLPSEEHGELAAFARAEDGIGSGAALSQGVERVDEGSAVVSDEDGAMLEVRAGGGQRVAEIQERDAGLGREVREQPLGLPAQRRLGLGRQDEGEGGGRRRRCAGMGHRSGGRGRRFFDDDVGVCAGDAERGDPGAAWMAVGLPGHGLVEEPDGAGGPVDVGGRILSVQGPGQDPVLHRQDHLDDAADARGGLGMPQVGLEASKPKRIVPGMGLSIGGEQSLGLDRVAERGARAVGLDRIDLAEREPSAGERLPDDALLRGTVRRGEPLAPAVLIDRGAAQDGKDGMTVSSGLGEALEQDHPGAFGEAGAVGLCRECPATAVGGEPTLATEHDEGTRGRHEADSTGQREGTLALTQGLAGEVERDERGAAGRVDGDSRTVEAEGVGDASGGHARQAADADVPLEVLGRLLESCGVIVEDDADEDAGLAPLEGGRDDARALEGLPGSLEQQTMLGVDGEGLAGADAEEGWIEAVGVVDEAALARIALALGVGVRVVERIDIPAAVLGKGGDGVLAVHQELPERLRRASATRKAAAHRYDRDRLSRCVDELLVLLT
ncbi:hypothetical protein WME85_05795 [Sorangium sp. So ce1153]